jgi:peptide/nickel transport system permease protein
LGFAYYVVRRLALLLFVLLGVVTLTFFLAYIIPGDPARLQAGTFATGEQVAQVRKELGLDKPVYEQFLLYLQRLSRGDLGTSIQTRRPVLQDISDYFTATFELTTISMTIAIIVGIPLGVISAVKKDKLVDHVARLFSLSGVSMPSFWLAMLLQLFLSVWLGIFPLSERVDYNLIAVHPLTRITGLYTLDSLLTFNLPVFLSAIQHMILPALVLSYGSLVVITRMTRATMLEVLRQDYIRTAMAYGLKKRIIFYKYALKNALIPTITIVGLSYGYLLAGTFLVEIIFSWPGLGRYAAYSIVNADYPAIVGVSLLVAMIYLLINFFVDVLYALLDPRIRYR